MGFPKIKPSVTKVLKPSNIDEHTKMSAAYIRLYGFSRNPSSFADASKWFS